MNKYLLLRDNKQTGPYTVQELISNGIKAYDLVWLEGRSAAWRYPSEVDELKAYAPVVEEQPFDRFYKKPEPVKQNIIEIRADHSAYEPKPVEKTEIPAEPSRKVYINFPAAQSKTAVPEPVVAEKKKIEAPVFPERINSAAEQIAPSIPGVRNNYTKNNNNYFKYTAIAACLLLVSLVTYLVISYNRQRQNINELNALVQKLGEKEKPPKTVVIPASIVRDEVPETSQSTNLNYSEEIANEKPVNPTVKPVNSSVEKPRSGVSEKENIVFKEAKTNPVSETPAPAAQTAQGSESDNSVPHENLFKLVSVKSNDYKTGVLGGISNLQLELTNNSLYELHKVAVEIKYLGPEKKVVRTQTVYFENVAPGEQTVLEVPKSSRGVSIDYAITDIKS